MKKNIALLLLFLIVCGLWLYELNTPRHSLVPTISDQKNSKTILVSIAPYAFFVNQITGGNLPVMTLIPEGANPHIYEPKPKEVSRVRNADVWIRLGDAFDQKVYQVLTEQNPRIAIVDMTQGIALVSECEQPSLTQTHHHCMGMDEEKDIHIWLSPKLAQIQAKTIATALIQAFPEHRERYLNNLNSFLNQLRELDQQIATLLASKKGTAILVSHPAFTYFCRDYDLVQLSVEIEGKDPLPQQITQLLQQARSYTITTIILEPQYSNKGAELIAEQLRITPVTIDPYAENYLDNLRLIAEIIAKSP